MSSSNMKGHGSSNAQKENVKSHRRRAENVEKNKVCSSSSTESTLQGKVSTTSDSGSNRKRLVTKLALLKVECPSSSSAESTPRGKNTNKSDASITTDSQEEFFTANEDLEEELKSSCKISEVKEEEQPQLAIPQRNNVGTKGRTIRVETNHLPINFQKLDRAVHYDVAITPTTPKSYSRIIVEEFRRKYYKKRYPAFDGVKNLYSSTELPFGDKIDGEVTILKDGIAKPFKVVVKFANFVDFTPLKDFLNASSTPIRLHHKVVPQEAVQCLDVVLRSAPALAFIPVGRSFFSPPKNHIVNLGNGMELYYGFYQSVIVGWKPFLNVDVAHKAFPKPQNVVDLIMELCGLNSFSIEKPLQRYHHETVDHYLQGLKIRYELPNRPESKREYRINGLEKSASESVFKPKDRAETTVKQYFLTEKNIVLKFPHLPCLWVGNRDRKPHILLPPEFCTLKPAQIINGKLPENVTSAMIKQTTVSTDIRKKKIVDAVKMAQYSKDPCVKEFGITVSDEFTKIDARVLQPPALAYYANSLVQPSKGVWKAKKFLKSIYLSKWTIIVLDQRAFMDQIGKMVSLMTSIANDLGMHLAQPEQPYIKLQPRSKKEVLDILKKRSNYQLLLMVIPNSGPMYSYVKEAAEVIIGCLTQCVRSQTISRINSSTVINILLKINAKLQGTNHSLHEIMKWMSRPYMIMGADVTHPAPNCNKPSIVAVTASFDVKGFKYNICWRLQPPYVEIIEDLKDIVKEQLKYFYKTNNGCKPERILFFRDGVSEGQFAYVMNKEIQAIRQACLSLQPDGTYKPKITFLVVQKRHHTRFFPLRPEDAADKNLNVPVGTCVDTVITHPTALEFCLVSHASIQGVARPTKYRVLWDDADMIMDDLEQITFYLCHMFCRCTRSVSYPAPTYYAHLAAARIMTYYENKTINMSRLNEEEDRCKVKECIIKDLPMFFV